MESTEQKYHWPEIDLESARPAWHCRDCGIFIDASEVMTVEGFYVDPQPCPSEAG
jgi:hypothetical protein